MARMAYKNKTNNLIAYKGDHEPVKIAVGGKVVDNLSYTEATVDGKSSVAYASEYKKNVLCMEIQGDSAQLPIPEHLIFEDVSSATDCCGAISGEVIEGDAAFELYRQCWGAHYIVDEDYAQVLILELPEAWLKSNTIFKMKRKSENEITCNSSVSLINFEIVNNKVLYIRIGQSVALLEEGISLEQKVKEPIYTHIMLRAPSGEATYHSHFSTFLVDYKLNVSQEITVPEQTVPTIESPMDITSTGDNGLSLKLRRYQEVEYISSTGTQYIDTGLLANNGTGVHIEFSSSNVSGSQYVLGTRRTNGNATVEFAVGGSQSDNYWKVFLGGTSTGILTRVNNRKGQIKIFSKENNVKELTFTNLANGAFLTNTVTQSVSSTIPMFLFAYNGPSISYGKAKIYFCKIYDYDALVRDFVPCIDVLTNEAGLYDTVTGVFYTNAGTGTFKAGDITGRGFGSIAECDVPNVIEYTPNYIYNSTFTNGYIKNGQLILSRTGTDFNVYLSKGNYKIYGKTNPTQMVSLIMDADDFFSKNFKNGDISGGQEFNVTSDRYISAYMSSLTPFVFENFRIVKMINGNEETVTVNLNLAKIGDSADSLIIDTSTGMVKYIKRVYTKIFTSDDFANDNNEWGTMQGYDNVLMASFTGLNLPYPVEGTASKKTGIMCNYLAESDDAPTDVQGIKHVWDGTDNTIPLLVINVGKNDKTSSLDKLKNLSDFTIQYALNEPVVIDITPSDFAQKLLEWAKKTINGTNVIEVTSSTLPITNLSVDYAKWIQKE